MINKPCSANISFKSAHMKISQKPLNEDSRLLSNISKHIKNSADMNDTITVPRTIFKGYLGVMAGTSLMTIASLLKNSSNKFAKFLKIAGTVVSLYGTYAFVRPFLIKDKPANNDAKNVDDTLKIDNQQALGVKGNI